MVEHNIGMVTRQMSIIVDHHHAASGAAQRALIGVIEMVTVENHPRQNAAAAPQLFDNRNGLVPAMKNGFYEEAIAAWEKSLALDPSSEAVKKKIEEGRNRLRRVEGERSKASH